MGHPKCQMYGCSHVACFGKVLWQGRRCRHHKEEDDWNVMSYHCKYPGCPKLATFGTSDITIPCWCRDHAPNDCIRRHRSLCDVDGCTRDRNYGFPGESRTRCGFHKEEGMTRDRALLVKKVKPVKAKPKCVW